MKFGLVIGFINDAAPKFCPEVRPTPSPRPNPIPSPIMIPRIARSHSPLSHQQHAWRSHQGSEIISSPTSWIVIFVSFLLFKGKYDYWVEGPLSAGAIEFVLTG